MLWVFGYGSLVSPPSMARTLERDIDKDAGWRTAHLVGFGRRWNYGSLTLRGNWRHGDDLVEDGVVISLGLVEAGGESCNGVAVRVTTAELGRLDWRERDYERTDITEQVTTEAGTVDGRIFTYVPRPSAIARYEDARDAGRGAVRRTYWNLVHDAFADLGSHHLDHLAAHTPAPDVPIVDVTLRR
jgi:dephospho-CoA kinase